MRAYKIGDTIYHERPYWKSEGLLAHERPGWNAEYIPFTVVRITPKTIYVEGRGVKVQLPRGERPKRPGRVRHETLETDGRQYHSRFHEYFYAEVPEREPIIAAMMPKYAHALLMLGIAHPYSNADVQRAYKRMARRFHPDTGGSHHEFIRLQEARDIALRRY